MFSEKSVSTHKDYNLAVRVSNQQRTFDVEFYLPHSEIFMKLKNIDFFISLRKNNESEEKLKSLYRAGNGVFNIV